MDYVMEHVVIQANAMNVQIFAKVAVMVRVMVHVSHLLKEKILQNLRGNLKIVKGNMKELVGAFVPFNIWIWV